MNADTAGSQRRRRTLILIAGLVVLLIAAIIAFTLWFTRDDAPDEVDLDTAAEQLTTSTTASGANPSDAPSDSTGTWNVDTSIGEFSFENATSSFVGFRLDEELAGIGSTEAVGRTPEVEGSLTIEDGEVTAVDVTASMAALVTDDSRRDDRARGALETDRYPDATFSLTAPVTLPTDADSGTDVSVDATGDLTIHGVTKPVTVALDARLDGSTITVVGSAPVTFSDFGVEVPSAPIVLSASDTGTIELQLFFARS